MGRYDQLKVSFLSSVCGRVMVFAVCLVRRHPMLTTMRQDGRLEANLNGVDANRAHFEV